MLPIITALIISYLIGSVPTAYLFVRVIKGIDIRSVGSGNVGATNALRILGTGPGIAVLAIDIAKGACAVLFLGNTELLRIVAGIACIIGHNWTVFLNFRGGKGMATSLGVLFALGVALPGMRLVLPIVLATWLAAFLVTRIVSLSSIISVLLLPLYVAVFRQSVTLLVFSVFLTVFVVLRHRTNIARIRKGLEPKLLFKKHL